MPLLPCPHDNTGRDPLPFRSFLLNLVALTGLLAGIGCGGAARHPVTGDAATPAPAPTLWPQQQTVVGTHREDCDLPAGPVRPGGHFVVAVLDSVRPRLAPVPRNRAERLVFGQLYETLVRVGCDGAVSAGLASHWTCGADSTVWVFTLRDEARTWDGERLTAMDVWRSWQENRAAPVDDGASPWNWFDPRTGSVAVLDARRLSVRLPEPQRTFPLLLAHPATAVAVRRDGWAWPVGSGPCRLTRADGSPRPLLTCRPHAGHPRAPSWETLVFRVLPGVEAATLAGETTDAATSRPVPDLVWTRDLAAVRVFLAVPAWRARALPWDRVHLLVCPPGLDRAQAEQWFAAGERLVPERDVVAVSARRWAAMTLPGAGAQRCPQLSGPVAALRADLGEALAATLAAAPATVIFPQDDPAARALAFGLADLVGPDARAVPLTPGAAAAALQRGETCASVVPVPQSYADGCLQMAALLGRAAWLQRAGLAGGVSADAVAATLGGSRIAAPLAVTRAWLVTRDGLDDELSGITLFYDACPDLAGLGRALAPAAETPGQP